MSIQGGLSEEGSFELRLGGALRRSEGRHARQRDQSQGCHGQLCRSCTAQGAAALCTYTSGVQEGAVTGLKDMQKPRDRSELGLLQVQQGRLARLEPSERGGEEGRQVCRGWIFKALRAAVRSLVFAVRALGSHGRV